MTFRTFGMITTITSTGRVTAGTSTYPLLEQRSVLGIKQRAGFVAPSFRGVGTKRHSIVPGMASGHRTCRSTASVEEDEERRGRDKEPR